MLDVCDGLSQGELLRTVLDRKRAETEENVDQNIRAREKKVF